MPLSQADLTALIARVPDTDNPGRESTFTGPEPAAAQKIFEEILAGGPGVIAELIRMLRGPEDPGAKDFRAEYVLHGLAVYVCQQGRDRWHQVFAETLASNISRSDLPKAVRGRLIRELQWVGGPEAIAAISGQLADEELWEDAVAALVAIGRASAAALQRALPAASGKRRLGIIQALGVVGDLTAAAAIRDAARDHDSDTRIAALWALANMGDADSAAILLTAGGEGWERNQARRSCLLLAEKLVAAGKKDVADGVYHQLREISRDPADAHVRAAADRGLAAVK